MSLCRYKIPHSFPRRFSLVECVVETTHKILPNIIYTLVLNHAVRWVHWIDWKSTNFVLTLARKVGNASPIFDLSRTWPNIYAKLFPTNLSITFLLWAFLSLSTITISTSAHWNAIDIQLKVMEAIIVANGGHTTNLSSGSDSNRDWFSWDNFKFFQMKNFIAIGKLMINFVFVNCPRVKNKLFHFTIDNIFSALLIR